LRGAGRLLRPTVNNVQSTVFAICGKEKRYRIETGISVDSTGGQVQAVGTCPRSTVALGGGVNGANDLGLIINSSAPLLGSRAGWSVYYNNTSGFEDTVTAYATCAA